MPEMRSHLTLRPRAHDCRSTACKRLAACAPPDLRLGYVMTICMAANTCQACLCVTKMQNIYCFGSCQALCVLVSGRCLGPLTGVRASWQSRGSLQETASPRLTSGSLSPSSGVARHTADQGVCDSLTRCLGHHLDVCIFSCMDTCLDCFDQCATSLEETLAAAADSIHWSMLLPVRWLSQSLLCRFDHVYEVYFKCNKKFLHQYPHISNYVKDIYHRPGEPAYAQLQPHSRHGAQLA